LRKGSNKELEMFKKLAGLAVVASLFFAGAASADIDGTAHDFVGTGWNSTGEICIVCHTTHTVVPQVSDAPLWNHTLTAANFTVYDNTVSGTMNSAPGQPQGISLLCLSCHDGTIGLDAFGGSAGVPTLMTGANVVGLGGDLTNDHPISFDYTDGLATTDGGLNPPTTTVAPGLGGNINTTMLFGAGNDQLECGSCHDVHDDTNGNFLIMSNANSALCTTCHSK
jgi:predicted CXXCH cytochrome family protein